MMIARIHGQSRQRREVMSYYKGTPETSRHGLSSGFAVTHGATRGRNVSSSFLRLRWSPGEPDGAGELEAVAALGSFSDRSSAWFNGEAIKEFARALSTHPLTGRSPPTITGGYHTPGTADSLEQEHVGITVYPIDTRGHIGVQVRLATPLERGMRPEAQCSARIEIRTTYEPLARFSRELLAVIDGSADEAVLDGEEQF